MSRQTEARVRARAAFKERGGRCVHVCLSSFLWSLFQFFNGRRGSRQGRMKGERGREHRRRQRERRAERRAERREGRTRRKGSEQGRQTNGRAGTQTGKWRQRATALHSTTRGDCGSMDNRWPSQQDAAAAALGTWRQRSGCSADASVSKARGDHDWMQFGKKGEVCALTCGPDILGILPVRLRSTHSFAVTFRPSSASPHTVAAIMAQQGATLQNYVRSHAASRNGVVGWVPLCCCQLVADAAFVLRCPPLLVCILFPLCQNNELVRCLEDLREKRELLNKTVSRWDAACTRSDTTVFPCRHGR